MSPGPSSVLTKDVMEEFCVRFLKEPATIFISESGNKVVERDDALARNIGLKIEPDRDLPDAILVDLGTKPPLLIFVEAVVNDGAITTSRREALLKIAEEAGYKLQNVVFVTAFQDRGSVYRRLSSELAWGSFVWFASEPDHIMVLRGTPALQSKMLFELI